MKDFEDLVLHIAIQVDEQITAAHQVELGKRGIAQHVVRGE